MSPKRLSRSLATAFAVLLFLGAARVSQASIAWTADFRGAQAVARAQNKPILIDFYTDWCGWCKKLDSDVYPTSIVQREAQGFVMVKLNAEAEGSALAAQLHVTGYPTLVFLTSDLRLIGTIPGYMEAGGLAQAMSAARQANRQAVGSVRRAAPRPAATKPSAVQRPTFAKETIPQETVKTEAQPAWSTEGGSVDKNAAGVYLLDENGATRLDKPAAKPRPVTKAPAKAQAKSTKG